MAQLFYLCIYIRIFLDIRIGGSHIRFRLVIIIVGDKILHCVLRKELLEFAMKLCSKCFIMRNDQCRFLYPFNQFCHSKRLAGPGDSHKRLCSFSI